MTINFSNRNLFFNAALIITLLLSSCASREDMVYFQDEPIADGMINSAPKQLIYKPDDILTINVSAIDPKTVQPFNLSIVSEGDDLTVATGSTRVQTYLIDYNGNIEFPVLGTIHLAGLTRIEATAFLKEKISEYVKDPS